MNIEVQKEDIKRIGETIFDNDKDNACFVCNTGTANIESILLRNILKCFGDYEILSEEDWYWGGDVDTPYILLTTNMPYSSTKKNTKAIFRPNILIYNLEIRQLQ